MALTTEELQRIVDIETEMASIQTNISNLASKSTLRNLLLVRQKEIVELQNAVELNSGSLSGPLVLKKQAAIPTAVTDYGGVYAYDDGGGTTEVYAQDSAGNSTQISPHNEDGEWEYFSRNTNTGKVVRINMEEMIRDVEELTGKKYIKNK